MTALKSQEDKNTAQEILKAQCTVKWFNLKLGYGFLEAPAYNLSDIFMHFSVLEEAGYQHVSPGDELVCDLGQGRSGMQANKIHSIKSAHGQPQNIPLVLEEKTGVVKWFNILRGYGFIEADDGDRDIFVHTGSLRGMRVDRLLRGQRVNAKILYTERGREAREIQLLESQDTELPPHLQPVEKLAREA